MATQNALNNTSAPFTVTSGDMHVSAGNVTLPTTSSTVGQITLNGNRFMHGYGTVNTFLGSTAGNFTLSSFGNTALGAQSMSNLTSGQDNTAVGNLALGNITSGNYNTVVGEESSTTITTGQYHTAIGYATMSNLTGGSSNIAIGVIGGSGSGDGWATGTESNNIAIANLGTNNTSGRIDIGTNATHTKAFIAGIDGVNVGSVAKVVTEASDQLGTATITAGTGITITPTANTITITNSLAAGASFSAYLLNDAMGVTGDGTTTQLICDTSLYDNTASYNTGTGVFTAPATGHYVFGVNLMFYGTLVANTIATIALSDGAGNNRQIAYFGPYTNASTNGYGLNSSTIALPLTIGDTIQINVAFYGNGTPNINFTGYAGNSNQISSLFYGYRVA